ncbi:MAG: MMPL family transporter [Candidatus Dormibacteraeota bacterium]|nr:MMPL family transporter [Candidatus Dormibacteraeota bacterium]
MFAAWGRFVFHRKWWVLAASALLLGAVAGVGFSLQGQLNNTTHVHFESQRASDLLNSQFPKVPDSGGSSFEVLITSSTLPVTDPAYRAAVEEILQPLRNDSRVKDIQTVYDLPAAKATSVTSRNGKETLAFVNIKDSRNKARTYFSEIRDKVKPSGGLETYVTGGLAINSDFDTYLADDLQRAELASIPFSILFLALVFGTLIAALLPVGVGGAAVVAGVAGTLLLARFTDVSTYAINIVTLVGLGVAIDYSLLIVNRFREELLAGATTEAALERSMATAGRAVTFSGLTVAIGLAGMLFYPGTFLVSMGLAGSIVVAMAVIFALTMLPSLLTLSGGAVNRFRVPWFGNLGRGGFWKGMAGWVMKRPLLVLLPTLALILLAASPFAQIKIANGDEHMLPPQAASRVGLDRLAADFPGQDQNTMVVILYYRDGLSLSKDRVDQLYDYGQWLLAKPNVIRVDSPVTFSPDLGKAQYEALFAAYNADPASVAGLPADAQSLLKSTLAKNIAVFYVGTNQPTQSDAAITTLKSLRDGSAPPGAEVLVTGSTAFNQDFINLILEDSPAAIAFVILVTYVVLFLLVGSVVLPLKAVVTNLLSISASFGVLVYVFQQGHLSGLLNFTPQAIDPTVPVIMFCIVFGLSMDYEVMLLTRIQEVYRKTGDNSLAVAEGLERSGRIISGAAAIMIAVFLAFGLAQVLLIKAIGLGLATAVLIDATLMRMLIVPSVMRLLGNLNWWAPHPLARLHGWLRLGDEEAAGRRPGVAVRPEPTVP